MPKTAITKGGNQVLVPVLGVDHLAWENVFPDLVRENSMLAFVIKSKNK